jgi:hypothetical protein
MIGGAADLGEVFKQAVPTRGGVSAADECDSEPAIGQCRLAEVVLVGRRPSCRGPASGECIYMDISRAAILRSVTISPVLPWLPSGTGHDREEFSFL